MWIVYRKKDRKVVGMSALCEPDLEKGAALAEVVNGLLDGERPARYDALQVQDRDEALGYFAAPLGRVVIKESRNKLQPAVETPEESLLVLSADAQDLHPVDGIPEIKADGSSFTTITVRKTDQRGQPRNSRGDNDELYLRTTAGTLLSADGKEAVATVKLKQGEASFRLVSETARRVATVTVFNGDPSVQDASVPIEFF